MADSLNRATKYVVTHRPASLAWGPAQAVGPDLGDAVRQLKAQDGPDLLLWGSSTLASPLLEHGLAEELVLLVYPVLLGTGKRLFPSGIPARRLECTHCASTPSGVLITRYTPHGPFTAS